jgi:hypothetical protein
MTTIDLDLSTPTPSLAEFSHLAGEGNVVLRTPEGKEFLLAELDAFALEVALVRQQPELMALLEERSATGKRFTSQQVREQMGLS